MLRHAWLARLQINPPVAPASIRVMKQASSGAHGGLLPDSGKTMPAREHFCICLRENIWGKVFIWGQSGVFQTLLGQMLPFAFYSVCLLINFSDSTAFVLTLAYTATDPLVGVLWIRVDVTTLCIWPLLIKELATRWFSSSATALSFFLPTF